MSYSAMGKSANKRIGILGGTFNPVHNGHLHLAKHALKKLGLDKVIFVPVYIPPHKKIRGNAKTADRIRMIRWTISGEKRFALSMCEIRRKGKSYSIKTARALKKKFGKGTGLFFLIGADSLGGLKKWKDFSNLSKLVRFAVFTRPGFGMGSVSAAALRVSIPGKDVSSTEIRRMVREGKSVSRHVPEAVFKYIEKNRLYRK